MPRPFVSLLAFTLLLAPLLRGADEPPAELNFSGEPIGSEYPIARGLEADATDLLGADKTIGLPDAAAATLQQGRLVRAFAEALSIAENADPVIAARSHARRALILARLGAVNFAAEHANQALAQPAVRGEVRLARAWMLWHAGNLEAADGEAALATGAPAWALAEWQAHRAKYATALAKFLAAPEPDDRFSPEFLAYVELAASSRAFALADGLYFSAVSNLQMQFNHEANFPPANLQRARRGFRDLVRLMLGDVAREPGAPRLAAVVLATAREVCATPAPRADWDIYLKLIAEIRGAQPSFDLAHYDLHGDLTRAEKEAALDPAWREKFKPLLADPRQRLASRVHQALARLEAHPAAELLAEPLDTAFTPEQRATLQAGAALLDAEDAVLHPLVQALPAGTAPGPRDAEFVVTAAKLRFRLALLDRDVAAVRAQLAKLEQFPDADPSVSLEAYRAQLTRLERGPFLEAYAKLLRYPPTDVPEQHLTAALIAADDIDDLLSDRHGDAYLFESDLPPDSVTLVQQLCHIRVLAALNTGAVLAAERALADLELWCDPKKQPPFGPLPDLIAAVTKVPAQEEKLTAEEQKIWSSLKSGRSDPAFPKDLRAAMDADELRWAPHLLLPIAHWRLGQDDLALAAIADSKELVRYNRASLDSLEALVANNDPASIVRRLIAGLEQAPGPEKAAKAQTSRKDLDALLRNLSVYFCGGQRIELKKLPRNATRVYAVCVAGYVRCHLAENRLPEAINLLEALETVNNAEALALARPAVEGFAFTNDLPDEAARATWRRLLDPGIISTQQISAALEQLKPASDAGSISAGMIAILAPYRGGSLQQARNNLAMLQRLYGRNRAVAAQLRQFSDLLNAGSGTPALDFNESIDSLLERRRNLHQTAVNYKDANLDALADAFVNNYSTPERRHLEALSRDVDAVTAQIEAVEARQRAEREASRRQLDSVRQEAYATLRRLMQL